MRQYLVSNGKDCSAPDFAADADWADILRIARHNKCDSFIYQTIRKWNLKDNGLDIGILNQYKKELLFMGAQQIRAEAELIEVITEFNNAGVEFMLLKGKMLADLYPDPVLRFTYDADIYISSDYIDKTEKILFGRGYINIPNEAVVHEKTFTLNGILVIDLHTRLFDKFYEYNRMAVVESGLELSSNRMSIQIMGVSVDTLSINHLFIYMVCHHAKHFISSGITTRDIIDLCVYVNKYNEQLDWDLIMTILNRFGLKEFALNLLYICQHYLNMADLSLNYDYIEDDVILMLLHDIIERTADGDSAFERSSAKDIVENIYFGSRLGTKYHSITSTLFPGIRSLSPKYRYAIKKPVLLPIAWVHRVCSYFWRLVSKQRIVSHAERKKIAKDRVTLLKRVKIL